MYFAIVNGSRRSEDYSVGVGSNSIQHVYRPKNSSLHFGEIRFYI